MFVLFTADRSMCAPCDPMRKELKRVAREYESLSERKKAPKPTFFAELKISASDRTLLRKYAIQHVPILYAFRSSSSRTYPTALKDEAPDNYPLQQLGISANQFKNFINARSGAKFKIVRGGYQIPFVQTVRAFTPVILMIVALAVVTGIVTKAYMDPMVWFGLVVLVYIFSVGGGHFSWIHNTPLAVVNKDGGWEYIAKGSRSQYVAEGFLVSATCVSISVLVILIQEMPSVISDKTSQTFVGMMMLTLTMIAISALLAMYQSVRLLSDLFHYFDLGATIARQTESQKITGKMLTLGSLLSLFICLLQTYQLDGRVENASVSSVQRDVKWIGFK